MPAPGLQNLGWDSYFETQRSTGADPGRPARVLEVQKSRVRVSDGEHEHAISPMIAGKPVTVAVGDWVLLDEHQRIESLLERKSVFRRRAPGTDSREQLIAANVDTAFIVSSCNQDFNVARIERYLAMAKDASVLPVVVLTRLDLCDEPGEYVAPASRLAPGLVVEAVNALDAATLEPLQPWLACGQTVALLGSSGVGKSTLTNTLLGKQQIPTATVREDDDKGRHTTTSRVMHELPGGAWLIDMPGMREVQLADVRQGIDDVFEELSSLAGRCRFADCRHEDEPGCAIRSAIATGSVTEDRLRRWQKLMREDARNRESLAERRARDKATGRLYKDIIGGAHHVKGRGPKR